MYNTAITMQQPCLEDWEVWHIKSRGHNPMTEMHDILHSYKILMREVRVIEIVICKKPLSWGQCYCSRKTHGCFH